MTAKIGWPSARDALAELQAELGRREYDLWTPPRGPLLAAGCFVCFPRATTGKGKAGEQAWAAAVLLRGHHLLETAVVEGVAGGPYQPGLLALREGPLLERAVGALRAKPNVLLVNATGRDHPRRSGLALHLGVVLDLPSIGVTDRPLLATATDPGTTRREITPLLLDSEVVGAALRTRAGARAVFVHAAHRTDASIAVEVATRCSHRARTPEPIRRARRLARLARAGEAGEEPDAVDNGLADESW